MRSYRAPESNTPAQAIAQQIKRKRSEQIKRSLKRMRTVMEAHQSKRSIDVAAKRKSYRRSAILSTAWHSARDERPSRSPRYVREYAVQVVWNLA